jgi:RHS repeat-associated protein
LEGDRVSGLLARTENPKLAIGAPFATAYYVNDRIGSVMEMLYTNSLPAAEYEYDPYGNILTMSGPLASANRYRYSGEEWNDNAGLYYYGRRFYDPNLQRWLNRDPIQELGGINLYEFSSNSPVDMIDLLGLAPPVAQPPTTGWDTPSTPPVEGVEAEEGSVAVEEGEVLAPGLIGPASAVAVSAFPAAGVMYVFLNINRDADADPNGVNAAPSYAISPNAILMASEDQENDPDNLNIAREDLGFTDEELEDLEDCIDQMKKYEAAMKKRCGKAPSEDDLDDFIDSCMKGKGYGPNYTKSKK